MITYACEKNIKQLKQVIDDYLKGKDQSIKIVMLREFSNSLGYILDKYKMSFLPKKEEIQLKKLNNFTNIKDWAIQKVLSNLLKKNK